jgi:hypothetical protein
MVIRNIITNEPAQMKLIEDNHMVEMISAAASNPAFNNPILPGTSAADPLWLNATGNQKISRIFAEFCVVIKNRVAHRVLGFLLLHTPLHTALSSGVLNALNNVSCNTGWAHREWERCWRPAPHCHAPGLMER